jgi:hypothetical protein
MCVWEFLPPLPCVVTGPAQTAAMHMWPRGARGSRLGLGRGSRRLAANSTTWVSALQRVHVGADRVGMSDVW